MKETMYMDETNSIIRLHLTEYIHRELDQEGNPIINYDYKPTGDGFQLTTTDITSRQRTPKKVTITISKHSDDPTVCQWYGQVKYEYTVNRKTVVAVLDERPMNIGNTIMIAMIVGEVPLHSKYFAILGDINIHVPHSGLETPVINVYDAATKTAIGSIAIRSLIVGKSIDDLVMIESDQLSKDHINTVYEWANGKYGPYDVTNAEVALYVWDYHCYNKIQNSRLLPNEIE